MDSNRLMRDAGIPAAASILQAAHKVDISYAGILARNWRLTPDSYWLLEAAGGPVGVVGSADAGLAFYPQNGFCWSGLNTEWHLRKRQPVN